MNEEVRDDINRILTRQYAAGFASGHAAQKINTVGLVCLVFIFGVIVGLAAGLGLTGWL